MFGKKKLKSQTAEATGAPATRETEGLSQGQIIRQKFFRHRVAVFSLFFLIFIILLETVCSRSLFRRFLFSELCRVRP